jgi:phthalate 4,5-cis-dihydrodiol dehydrogenase
MTQPLRVGVVGLGAAGLAFVPALQKHAGFEWVAYADPAASDAARATADLSPGVKAYVSLQELLNHPGLDAVIVATPTPLHAAQVQQAATAGLHVLVEKPMATMLDDARAMVQACARAGVVLLVGHSHGYDAPIAAMRAVIESGELGAIGMAHTWCYSDWVYRPRRPDELDATQGGGVTFRQGSHQFDILRLLCGGRARSVRAKAFDWDPQRRTVGAHVAFIDFEGGPAATAVYNGYGGFSSMDLCFDISEWGLHQPPGRRPLVKRPQALAGSGSAPGPEEAEAKRARAAGAIAAAAPHTPFFGLTLVSCERGDIRQAPNGLRLHTPEDVREVPVSVQRGPRERVLDEWLAAIQGQAPALHSGAWGLANLELCAAALASSREGREVLLHEQVGLPLAQNR